MIAATFNVFVIPLDLAFEPTLFQSTQFLVLNFCIDFLFLVDILLSFRTTYINDRTGAEIREVKLMAKNYLRGQFTIDLLATIPFDALAKLLLQSDNATFKVFGALKLVRVLRLNKIITYLRSTEEIKAGLKVIKLIFFLIMYLHCFGCIWYMIVSQEQIWVHPLLYGNEDVTYLYNQSIIYRYFTTLHAAVLLTTGNDIGPRNTFQVFIGSMGLFLGAIINANILGELAVLVSQLNAKSAEFQNKITQINTTIKNLKIPKELEDKVREYIITNQSSLEGQQELSRFMKLLSPSIKSRVIKHEFYSVVKKQTVFAYDERIVEAILEKLSLNLYKPEKSVCV